MPRPVAVRPRHDCAQRSHVAVDCRDPTIAGGKSFDEGKLFFEDLANKLQRELSAVRQELGEELEVVKATTVQVLDAIGKFQSVLSNHASSEEDVVDEYPVQQSETDECKKDTPLSEVLHNQDADGHDLDMSQAKTHMSPAKSVSFGDAVSPDTEETCETRIMASEAEHDRSPNPVFKSEITRRSSEVMVPTETQEQRMLRRILTYTEKLEDQQEAVTKAKKHPFRYLVSRAKNISRDEMDMLIDVVMGYAICFNAAVMGISMDYSASASSWSAVELAFVAVFLGEMVAKIALHGFFVHFFGPLRLHNWLDAAILLADIMQLILDQAIVDSGLDGLPSASLLRLMRVIKLSRILRLLELPVFADVQTMIQGIIGGMGTLMWSLVLYVIMVYMVALLCRTILGNKQIENIYDNFSSVPRSMLTTFRCSFGDCTTAGGQPIFEFVHESYGGMASAAYCFFVFCVSIGIFNVISAIFVESTLAAASAVEKAKKDERLQDERRWNTRITTLIRKMVAASGEHSIEGKLSGSIDTIYQVDVKSSVLDELVKLPEVKHALDDLDINPDDHRYLAELLDPDNGGTISVVDFINGLRRLRGDPRRSDIVHVNMMVRAMQLAVSETQTTVLEMQSQISELHSVLCPTA